MGLRFAILALTVLGYIIILLSNSGKVNFQFFMISGQVAIYYIIFLSTLFGVVISFYFFWMFNSYKSMRKKVRIIKDEQKAAAKSRPSQEGLSQDHSASKESSLKKK